MSEIRPELHLWVAYLEKKEQLEEAQDRIAELEAENAGLSANQCLHDIHGDESGNPYCPRIAELEAALRDVLPYVDTCNSSHREAQAKGYAALEGGKKDER